MAKHNRSLTINLVGFFMLITGLALIAMGLYMIPYVFWHVNYDVPEFAIYLQFKLFHHYQYPLQKALQWVFYGMLIVGGLLIGLARLLLYFLERE